MVSLLKIELRRLYKEKPLYIAIAAGFVLSIWLLIIELKEVNVFQQQIELYGIGKAGLYYPRSLFNSFIGLEYAYLPSTILYMIFPILVAFPFGASYYSERRTGYIKNIFIRVNKKDYYVAKFLAVFISGAFVTGVILGFSLIISAMFFPALPPELTTNTFTPQIEHQMWTEMFVEKPFLYTFIYCMIDMVFYGLIATISLAVSIIAKSSLFVLTSPMLLYVIFHFLFTTLGYSNMSAILFLRPCQIFVNADIRIIIVEAAVILCLTAFSFIKLEGARDVY